MAEEEHSDKSQEPTERKLAKAREKGEIARSPDLLTTMAYAGLLIAGLAFGDDMVTGLGTALIGFLDHPDRLRPSFFDGGATGPAGRLAAHSVLPVLPLFLVPAALVLSALLATRTLIFTGSHLKPRISRISPLKNAKNKFGRRGLFEFAKSFAKLVVYGACLGFVISSEMPRIAGSMATAPETVSRLLGQMLADFMQIVVVIALIIGVIDILWQQADHKRRNRMSVKELRDEMKETEGDPMLKQTRRARAQTIATSRIAQEVPKADVIVVNPTHFAVALKWSRARGTAPVCVAKGQDAIALRMREIAAEHGVPIHSDPPTARALYAGVRVGEEIGTDHYRAVAAAIRFADEMRRRAGEGWR